MEAMNKKLNRDTLKDMEAWHAAVPGGHRVRHDWVTELNTGNVLSNKVHQEKV